MSDVHRRDLLRTGAALFATTGVAAATAAGSDGSREDAPGRRAQDDRGVPEYADWIPSPDDGPAADSFRSVYSVEMDALLVPPEDENEGEGIEDPMVVNTSVAALIAAFSWLSLGQTGLDKPILGPATEEENPDPEAVPTDRHLLVGETQVFLGSFDDAALEDAVTAGNYAETDVDGIYAHGQQDLAVTWIDGAVILGPDADRVETVLDVGTGSIDRRYEIDSDFEWLLRTAGHGDLTVAVLSDDETVDLGEEGEDSDADFSMFEGSKGYAQSIAFETSDRVSATTAVVYASEDRVDRDRLESNLGTEADDRTVEQDGRNVTLDASYSAPTDDGEETDGGTETEDGGTETEDDGSATEDGGTEIEDGGTDDETDGGDESDDGTADADSETDESTEETDESGDDSTDDVDATEDEGATEDGTGSTETDDDPDGGDESDDDSLPGPGILGAVASVGGVGYLLSRRLPDEE